MTSIRLPRLLGPDLVEKARLHPDRASVTVSLSPLSTASMTLPEREGKASIRDYVEYYGPDGSLGIFRVASAQRTYGNKQQLNLEHGIVTLEDDMVPEGTVLSGDMKAMLSTLLSFQSRRMWTLCDVDVPGDLDNIEAGMSNLLEAVLTIIGQDETAMLAFDQSVFPWVMHVRKKPSGIACECRLNRNLSGVNVRLDDAELCTRVTVEDADGAFHTYDADTIGTWGVVHKAITIEDGDDPEEEAKKYLDAHKNPALSVELDALTLASLTGDALDSFVIGRMCRVALPEWQVAMDERIMSMTYTDLYGHPDQVRLTLSATRPDASTKLATLQSVARKNSRGIAQNLKYYHELDDRAIIMAKDIELLGEDIQLRATKDELGKYLNEVWIELDADKAAITLNAQHINKVTNEVTAAGERIDGLNATLTQYAGIVDSQGTLLSGVQVRLNGIEQTITQQAGEFDKLGNLISGAQVKIDGLNQTITQQAGQISAQGNLISGAQQEIDGIKQTITQQAGKFDELGNLISGAELRMDGIAATIDLKVSKDGLISAINLSPEQIRISSAKVVLDGFVTISEMEAEFARIDRLLSGNAHISFLDVGTGYFDYINCQGSMSFLGTFMKWDSASVMTALPSLSVETFYMTYKDKNNINQSVTVVTGVNFNRGTLGTLNYIGKQ